MELTSSCVDTVSSSFEIKYGTEKYVEYIVGGPRSKLVISATHGGNLRPGCIPSRNVNPERKSLESTDIRINADVYTKEMANMLRTEFQGLTTADETPHLIVCKYIS